MRPENAHHQGVAILLIGPRPATPKGVAEMNTGHLQSGEPISQVCCRCFRIGWMRGRELLSKDGKDSIGGIAGLELEKEWVRGQVSLRFQSNIEN
jgi:hypothetical protein